RLPTGPRRWTTPSESRCTGSRRTPSRLLARRPIRARRSTARSLARTAVDGSRRDPVGVRVTGDGRAKLSSGVDLRRAEAAVRELLIAIGENPERDGLKRTPARVAETYAEIFSGLFVN